MIYTGTTGKNVSPVLIDWLYGNDEGTVKVFSDIIEHDRGSDINLYVEPESGGHKLTEAEWDNIERAAIVAQEQGCKFIELFEEEETLFVIFDGCSTRRLK